MFCPSSGRVEQRRVRACGRPGRRELERQFKAALFELALLTPAKVSPPVRQMDAAAAGIFKDSYMLEFLELPAGHAEADLHRALLLKLRDFLIELGRDFCFVGSEYPLQVGGPGLCSRPAVLSQRSELPHCHRTKSWPI